MYTVSYAGRMMTLCGRLPREVLFAMNMRVVVMLPTFNMVKTEPLRECIRNARLTYPMCAKFTVRWTFGAHKPKTSLAKTLARLSLFERAEFVSSRCREHII